LTADVARLECLAGQEHRQKWKDEVPASGHDKELFFRKWGEISGLGVYASLCELMEGIVIVPLEHRDDEAALHEVQAQIAPYCRKCRGNLADMQRGNNSTGDGNQDDRPPGLIRQFHSFFRCG
jgi:hypothetical protein